MSENAWRYSINYGPEGESNYAMVYDADGALVSNLKTHHAIAVVNAMNIAAKALENGRAGLADANSKSPDAASQSERIAVLEAVKKAIRDGAADELNGAPCGSIIVKGCEAAEYVHPEDAAEMFVECIADEVMAALAPLGEE